MIVMSGRSVALTAGAVDFLENYEDLLGKFGMGPERIEQIAAHIIQLIWSTFQGGVFQNRPKYVGPDPNRPGHSMYEFDEPFITGKYTSTPDNVCVLILELNMPYVFFSGLEEVAETRMDAA
ncbi:MAG: hypothetical protein WAU78_17710 [Roseiarcus sp.]